MAEANLFGFGREKAKELNRLATERLAGNKSSSIFQEDISVGTELWVGTVQEEISAAEKDGDDLILGKGKVKRCFLSINNGEARLKPYESKIIAFNPLLKTIPIEEDSDRFVVCRYLYGIPFILFSFKADEDTSCGEFTGNIDEVDGYIEANNQYLKHDADSNCLKWIDAGTCD